MFLEISNKKTAIMRKTNAAVNRCKEEAELLATRKNERVAMLVGLMPLFEGAVGSANL